MSEQRLIRHVNISGNKKSELRTKISRKGAPIHMPMCNITTNLRAIRRTWEWLYHAVLSWTYYCPYILIFCYCIARRPSNDAIQFNSSVVNNACWDLIRSQRELETSSRRGILWFILSGTPPFPQSVQLYLWYRSDLTTM